MRWVAYFIYVKTLAIKYKGYFCRMTIAEALALGTAELTALYDTREAKTILSWVLEKQLSLKPYQLSLERFRLLTTHQQQQFKQALVRLKAHEPVQYILEEADFCGLKLYVNNQVLIPRPETEELVAWIKETYTDKNLPLFMADWCTGSGCIAVALAKYFTRAKVEALDISEQALQVAKQNSLALQANIAFTQLDILHDIPTGHGYDVIVSNPPYVMQAEKETLLPNVLNFEPHLALFAAANDDLIFYRNIIAKATNCLSNHGTLFLEIHHNRGNEVLQLLRQNEFTNTELRQDINGKNRMAKGVLING